MTEVLFEDPADLTRPEAREEFLNAAGLLPQEQQEAELIEEQGSKAKNLGMVALALGAGFLWYRRAMRRRLLQDLDNSVTATALDSAAHAVWSRLTPTWIKMMAPTVAMAYWNGLRGVKRGEVPPDLVRQASEEYARTLGDYMNETSAKALVEGFNSYVNKKVPRRIAATRAIEAVGLTPRQMRSVVAAEKLSAQTLNTVVEQLPDSKMKRHVQNLLLDRAKKMGDNESFSASRQAKQVFWMWQQQHGQISDQAYREWRTARDERVCEFCGPLHGKTTPINEPFDTDLGEVWMPALHPNCRCDVILREPTESLFAKNAFGIISKANPFDEDKHRRDRRGRFAEKPDRPEIPTKEQQTFAAEFLRMIPEETEEVKEEPKETSPWKKGTTESPWKTSPWKASATESPWKRSVTEDPWKQQKEQEASPWRTTQPEAPKWLPQAEISPGFHIAAEQARISNIEISQAMMNSLREQDWAAWQDKTRRRALSKPVDLGRPIYIPGDFEDALTHGMGTAKFFTESQMFESRSGAETVIEDEYEDIDRTREARVATNLRPGRKFLYEHLDGRKYWMEVSPDVEYTAVVAAELAIASPDWEETETIPVVDAETGEETSIDFDPADLASQLGIEPEKDMPVVFQMRMRHPSSEIRPYRNNFYFEGQVEDGYEVVSEAVVTSEQGGRPYRVLSIFPVMPPEPD